MPHAQLYSTVSKISCLRVIYGYDRYFWVSYGEGGLLPVFNADILAVFIALTSVCCYNHSDNDPVVQ